MTSPVDVQRNLDHCMMTITAASEAMTSDMHDAAMKLGAATMMLASASHMVQRHAAQLARPETGGPIS